MTKRPSVKTACVADRYHANTERIVEFSFPSGEGGLISLRTLHDGTPVVEVYRSDPNVHVLQPQPIAPGSKAARVYKRTTVRQTACKHCGQDIEAFAPYRRGSWRDRGNNTHCPDDSGKRHEPVPE